MDLSHTVVFDMLFFTWQQFTWLSESSLAHHYSIKTTVPIYWGWHLSFCQCYYIAPLSIATLCPATMVGCFKFVKATVDATTLLLSLSLFYGCVLFGPVPLSMQLHCHSLSCYHGWPFLVCWTYCRWYYIAAISLYGCLLLGLCLCRRNYIFIPCPATMVGRF